MQPQNIFINNELDFISMQYCTLPGGRHRPPRMAGLCGAYIACAQWRWDCLTLSIVPTGSRYSPCVFPPHNLICLQHAATPNVLPFGYKIAHSDILNHLQIAFLTVTKLDRHFFSPHKNQVFKMHVVYFLSSRLLSNTSVHRLFQFTGSRWLETGKPGLSFQSTGTHSLLSSCYLG